MLAVPLGQAERTNTYKLCNPDRRPAGLPKGANPGQRWQHGQAVVATPALQAGAPRPRNR